ncbi:MAG: hypothetical protein KBD78_08905 [Oligoflexales bacterium]|nr:hypothetical protein [Oligoflexales bacterium]
MEKIRNCLKLGGMFLWGSLAFSFENIEKKLVENYNELLGELEQGGSGYYDFLDTIPFPFEFIFSSDIRGNGGDTVDCDEDLKKSDTTRWLYDYVESRELRGIYNAVPNVLQDSVSDYLQAFLNRIAIHDPERAMRYTLASNQFLQKMQFVRFELKNISDTGEIPVYFCNTAQTAVQVKPVTSQDKRYLIRKSHWDKMDNFNRAGLILHEIIYSDALMYGHKNSFNTRYFNALVASDYLEKISKDKYFSILSEAGLANYKYYGIDKYSEDAFEYSITIGEGIDTEANNLCDSEFDAVLAECSDFEQTIFSYHFGKAAKGGTFWCDETSGDDPNTLFFDKKLKEYYKYDTSIKLRAICKKRLN